MPRAWASSRARVVAPVPSTPRGLARRRRLTSRRVFAARSLARARPRPSRVGVVRARAPASTTTPSPRPGPRTPPPRTPRRARAAPGSYAGWWTRADAVAASAVAADRAFDDDAVRLDDATRSVGAVRAPSAWGRS